MYLSVLALYFLLNLKQKGISNEVSNRNIAVREAKKKILRTIYKEKKIDNLFSITIQINSIILFINV